MRINTFIQPFGEVDSLRRTDNAKKIRPIYNDNNTSELASSGQNNSFFPKKDKTYFDV